MIFFASVCVASKVAFKFFRHILLLLIGRAGKEERGRRKKKPDKCKSFAIF